MRAAAAPVDQRGLGRELRFVDQRGDRVTASARRKARREMRRRGQGVDARRHVRQRESAGVVRTAQRTAPRFARASKAAGAMLTSS